MLQFGELAMLYSVKPCKAAEQDSPPVNSQRRTSQQTEVNLGDLSLHCYLGERSPDHQSVPLYRRSHQKELSQWQPKMRSCPNLNELIHYW